MRAHILSSSVNRRQLRSRSVLLAAAVAGLAAGSTMAASTWTGPSGTTAAPTSGNWNATGNWSPNGVPASSMSTELDFTGIGGYISTDDLSSGFQLNVLNLSSSGTSTIAAATGSSLSFVANGPTNPTIVQNAGAGTFTVSAPVSVGANTAINQSDGSEIDFTGNVTGAGSISISNGGTANSTVKFSGANTFSGLTVNAHATAAAALSSSTTTLGSGTVTLNGGRLLLQGQQANGFSQQAIGVTGFNADTIMDAAASTSQNGHTANATVTDNTVEQGTPLVNNGTSYVSSLYTNQTVPSIYEASDITSDGHIHNQTTLFQNGWNGKTDGISASGLITSTAPGAHVFSFAYNGTSTNFAAPNTLYFTNGGITDMTAKTLTLATPTQVQTLNFLAAAYVSSTFDVTLNFADGSSTYSSAINTGSDTAPTNLAYSAHGTNNGNSNNTDNGATIKFDEADLTLSTADQTRTLDSITFTPTSIGVVNQGLYGGGNANEGTAEIYAVSGVAFGNGVLQPTQTYSNNLSVTANSSIDVSGSLVATAGNLSTGATLALTSASTSVSPYSLTVGTVTLTANAGFTAANSTGGGAGTLNLGAISDGGSAKTVTIGAGAGNVTLTGSSNLVSGSTLNVVGTANLNNANAWGGTGTIVNVNGGTLNLNTADALGTSTGDVLNINSGTVNGTAALAATVAQVNMTGGTFSLAADQQISSLSGTAGTINLNASNLVVGNSKDNLSSSFGGVITATISGNFSGVLSKSGTGDLNLSGTSNTQYYTSILQGSITPGAPSTYTAGVISGPLGNGPVIVGDGGSVTGNNAALVINTPNYTMLNTVYYASGPHSIVPGLAQQAIESTTTGKVTFAGDIVTGSTDTGGSGNGILNGYGILGTVNGGEIDVTGNLIADHDAVGNPLHITNLSGTGNAVVKAMGLSNTIQGIQVEPNATFVAALSQSTHALGYGTVNLNGGTVAIQGQQTAGAQISNLVTNAGFNQKLIAPKSADNPSDGGSGQYALGSTTSTIDGGSVLYEKGYVNSAGTSTNYGVNSSGTYVSEYNPDVTFQLQPYTSNTALQFKGAANSGTLTLSSPGEFKTINILSMNGASTATVTFNFSDGSTEVQYLNTQQWYYGHYGLSQGGAIVQAEQHLAIGGIATNPLAEPAQRIGSITRSNDVITDYAASMYEDDFTLSALDQTKTLTSISFLDNIPVSTSSANIMAVSGQAYVAPSTLGTQTYTNNVAVPNAGVTTNTLDVSGSLNAVMGNVLSFGSMAAGVSYLGTPGNYTLNVTSSDTSGAPYSLALGTQADAGGDIPSVKFNATAVTFNVTNSAGSGTGTLTLGALDDTLDPGTSITVNKIGPGVMTLASPATSFGPASYGYTAAVNVTGGTLNINDPMAIGTNADLSVTGAAVNVGSFSGGSGPYSVTLHSLTVGTGGTFTEKTPIASGAANRTVVVTGTFSNSGLIDLTGNDMVVSSTSAASVFTQLQTGYNHGHWNGTTGIESSAAAGDSRHLTSLGYMQSQGGTFDGVSTSVSDTLIKYTYVGDANLDGVVNGADYQQIDAGYGSHASGWSSGDFNYDGVVDGSDFSLIDNAFNQTHALGLTTTPLALIASPSDLIAGSAVTGVPEPTTLGLLGIGAMGLMSRRRRRQM